MQAVNTQTLVHVGVELVVIGGMTFWFQRKTALLQEEIDQLRDKVTGCEGIIQNQGQLLAKHDQILRQILGSGGIPPIEGPVPGGQSGGQSGWQSGRPPTGNPSGPSRSPPSGGSPGTSPAQPPPREVEDNEPDLPPEELDRLLQEELGDVASSRVPEPKHSSTQPEFIEMECHDDYCEIKPSGSNRRLKKKNRRRGKGEKKV